MPSSLCPFLFLLITSPLIYDRTQENSFQVLICISDALLLALATSLPPLLRLPSWLPLPLFLPLSVLWSVLCGSSSISEQKHTLIPISALSVEYTTCPANNIHSASFFPSMSLWCEYKCAYIFPVISASCPYGGDNVNSALSVKRRSVRRRQITPNGSDIQQQTYTFSSNVSPRTGPSIFIPALQSDVIRADMWKVLRGTCGRLPFKKKKNCQLKVISLLKPLMSQSAREF